LGESKISKEETQNNIDIEIEETGGDGGTFSNLSYKNKI